jgi:hypothetical protein
VIGLLAGVVLLRTFAEGSAGIAPKSVRLRGIRQSIPVSLPLVDPRYEKRPHYNISRALGQDVRRLETMFENTETQKHVKVEHPTPNDNVGGTPIEAVEEAEELALMMAKKVPLVAVKEEPKELYLHSAGKTQKPKSSKIKGAPKSDAPVVAEEGEKADKQEEKNQEGEKGGEEKEVEDDEADSKKYENEVEEPGSKNVPKGSGVGGERVSEVYPGDMGPGADPSGMKMLCSWCLSSFTPMLTLL